MTNTLHYKLEEVNGIAVHIMHVANRLGWVATHSEKVYGNYTELFDNEMTEEAFLEHAFIHLLNAQAALGELKVNANE